MDCPTTTRILVALTGLHGLMREGGIAGDGDDGDRLGRGCGALENLEGESGGSLCFTYVVYMYGITKKIIKSNFKDKLSVKRLPESYRIQKFQPSQEGVENHKSDCRRKGQPGEMPRMVASGI